MSVAGVAGGVAGVAGVAGGVGAVGAVGRRAVQIPSVLLLAVLGSSSDCVAVAVAALPLLFA